MTMKRKTGRRREWLRKYCVENGLLSATQAARAGVRIRAGYDPAFGPSPEITWPEMTIQVEKSWLDRHDNEEGDPNGKNE